MAEAWTRGKALDADPVLRPIVDNIDSVLKKAGLPLKNVEGIGVGLGPGSWTGIRVGVTVGKILAFSTGKPVAGVPTLQALAYQVRHEKAMLCAVIGAGAGEAVYAALYRPAAGSVDRVGDYYVGSVNGLTGLLTGPAVLVGSGAAEYRKTLTREDSSLKKCLKAVEAAPGGAAVAFLAARRLARGESDDVLSLTPLYLKESTAKAMVNRYAGRAPAGK